MRKLIAPKSNKPKNKGSEQGHNNTAEGVSQDKLVALIEGLDIKFQERIKNKKLYSVDPRATY